MDARIFIAHRYAQAFLNLFPIDINDLPRLHDAINFLQNHKEIFSLLKVPLLDAQVKKQSLDEYVVNKHGLPASFKKLIALLVAQKRSYLIIDVLRELAMLFQDSKGIETFTIASCVQLDEQDKKKLYEFLADRTHHTVVCEHILDMSLIGGIRMQSPDHLWEYSIAKQLNTFKTYLRME